MADRALGPNREGRISIDDVGKVYDPEGVNVCALLDCNLEIDPGEFIMLVGPSGCGKTTLLNAIAGFSNVTSGTISLDDEIIAEPLAELSAEFINTDAIDVHAINNPPVRHAVGVHVGTVPSGARCHAAEVKHIEFEAVEFFQLSPGTEALGQIVNEHIRARPALGVLGAGR